MPQVSGRRPRPGSASRLQGRPGASPGMHAAGGPSSKMALAAGFLALVALGWALWAHEPQPDPNYVRARDAVAAYELGKDEEARNYDDPVYPEALRTLALVEPESVSAQPAEQLATRIRHATDAFHLRLKAGQDDLAERRKKVQQRFEANMMASTRARLTPDDGSPECAAESAGHAHDVKDSHGH